MDSLQQLELKKARLEQEAYDEKNKLLNPSQFQELLELQTDDEPNFVKEIVEMYITDAEGMLVELQDIFTEANFQSGKPDYNNSRAVLHKLKGSSSTFGADGVQQKCEELREHCMNEDLTSCRTGEGSLEDLAKMVELLKTFLTEYIQLMDQIHALKP